MAKGPTAVSWMTTDMMVFYRDVDADIGSDNETDGFTASPVVNVLFSDGSIVMMEMTDRCKWEPINPDEFNFIGIYNQKNLPTFERLMADWVSRREASDLERVASQNKELN